MIKIMEDYLEEYNFSATNQMNLVFFMDAAEHAANRAHLAAAARERNARGRGRQREAEPDEVRKFHGGVQVLLHRAQPRVRHH